MWYFNFNTPEEFLSYQDKIIKNWKRSSEYCNTGNNFPSELYRTTGRTTCEQKCISQLLNRGENVLYIVSKRVAAANFTKSLDEIVHPYKDNFTLQTFDEFIRSFRDICSVMEKQYLIFDHWIFESRKYPFLA